MNRKIKSVKLLFFLTILFCNKLDSRSYFSPLPYGYGWAFEGNVWNPDLLKKYYEFEDYNDYVVIPNMTLYNRSAQKAFDNDNSSITRDLSYIFHGSDDFYFGELFSDGIINNPDYGFLGTLDNINIRPSYEYNENGCVLGLTIQKDILICNQEYSLRFDGHIPIKKILVSNLTGENSIRVSSLDIPSPVLNEWFFLTEENGAPCFSARLDKLYENNIIGTQEQNLTSFVINKNINVIDQNQAEIDGIASTAMTLENIGSKNFAYINTGTPTNSGTISSVTGNNFQVNNITTNNYDSVLTTPATNQGIIPVNIYPVSPSNTLQYPFITNSGSNLTTSPETPDTITTNNSLINNFYYVNPSTNSILSSSLGTEFNICAANFDGVYNPVSYIAPPVIVQYSDSANPKTYNVNQTGDIAYEISLPVDPQANNGTFTPYTQSLVNYISVDNTNQINIIDGTNSTQTALPFSSYDGKPCIFWFNQDYKNIQNATNLSNFYVTTSIDPTTNEPTLASQILYDEILDYKNNLIEDNSAEKIAITNQIIQGWFVNGFVPGEPLDSPEFLYGWNDYKFEGIGDLDLQLAFGSNWLCNKVQADLILGLIFPTGPSMTQLGNYLAMPLGNNKHYEIRVGTQGGYDINNWVRAQGYLHYAWALPSMEQILTGFKNTTAFGLQPICLLGKINWNQFIASFDVSCFANERTACSFKYQYLFKTQDKISVSNDQSASSDGLYKYNAVNDLSEVSFCEMLPFTQRRAHKLEFSVSMIPADDFNIQIGASTIVAGKNMPKESDLFINLMITY